MMWPSERQESWEWTGQRCTRRREKGEKHDEIKTRPEEEIER